MTDVNELTVADPDQASTVPAPFTLLPRSVAEAHEFAKLIAASDSVPPDYKGKPANVLVAVQMGAELGLKPLQALQHIAIVNGRPVLYGDGLIALVRASAQCEGVHEEFDEATMTATCIAKRRGEPEQAQSFSQADAQTAGLWGRQGPWKQYPKRMLQMRARAFCLRDLFPDILKGLAVAEEVRDYIDVTPTAAGKLPSHSDPPTSTARVAAKLSERAQEARKAAGEASAEAVPGTPASGPPSGSPVEPDADTGPQRVAQVMTLIAQATNEDELEACANAVNQLDTAQRRQPGRALLARIRELKGI